MTFGLDGYFDESERLEGSEPISVAGYVFKQHGYKDFCRAWKKMLLAGPKPTTHFHMTHLYARTYEYEGWSVSDRAKVLRLATKAVKDNMLCGISVLLSQSEFEQLAPPLWRFNHGSIYTAVCQMVLRTTALWMEDHKLSLPIAYAFERGHRFWPEADAVMRGVGANPTLRDAYHYRTHFDLEKESAYGLQAADMLAWIMTRLNVGAPQNHTMRAFAPIITRLVKNDSERYQLFHPDGDALRRFFQEQMESKEHVIVDLGRAKKARLR